MGKKNFNITVHKGHQMMHRIYPLRDRYRERRRHEGTNWGAMFLKWQVHSINTIRRGGCSGRERPPTENHVLDVILWTDALEARGPCAKTLAHGGHVLKLDGFGGEMPGNVNTSKPAYLKQSWWEHHVGQWWVKRRTPSREMRTGTRRTSW